MTAQESAKVWTDTFLNEHETILRMSTEVCGYLSEQINSLITGLRGKNIDAKAVETIVSWKSILMDNLRKFSNYLKDHIDRETAFLDSFTEHGAELETLRKNEEVLEHLEELGWLLYNIPAREMLDYIGYIQQKLDELSQGIADHCQWGSQILRVAEE